MNLECEKLSKTELQDLDALLTKLLLYPQALTDTEPDRLFPKPLLEFENLPSEEELDENHLEFSNSSQSCLNLTTTWSAAVMVARVDSPS